MIFKNAELNVKDYDDFIKGFFKSGIIQIRIISVVFLALFLINALNIPQNSNVNSTFSTIQFYVLIPTLAIVLGVSYTDFFVRIGQTLMSFAFIVLGSGASLMLILNPNDSVLLGIIVLIELAGFLFIRLEFNFAALSGVLIFIIYIIGSITINSSSLIKNLPTLLLFFCSIAIGAIGNYYLYTSELERFLQNKKQLTEGKNLEKIMAAKVKEVSDSQNVTIFALAKLSESRDKNTGEHIERVGKYSLLLASKLEDKEYEKRNIIKEDFVSRIELASALHDIGKVGVSDSILVKPDKLTKEEFQVMSCHTLIGSETLDAVRKKYPNNSFINMGIEITRCHHEKYGGSGYPYGLIGDQIPLSARIVAIADVYDALISERPYKAAMTHEQAAEIIVNLSEYQFDPMLVKIFKENAKEFKLIAYSHQHPIKTIEKWDE